ncbi:helix-turn-helix domain-containing protein [Kitasatospora sp. NPDC101447]|uniref:helix-turn-helix domain-containing protein n=1 Tax=Kitasatospora sp. NPDC101447 TaxID=3364102 RepID=UPI0038213671
MPEARQILVCQQCNNDFTRTSVKGRPQRFCTARCRAASSRAAARRAAAGGHQPQLGTYDVTVSRLSHQVVTQARRLQRLADSQDDRTGPCAELDLLDMLRRDLEALTTAVVLQARERKVTWAMVSEVLAVSPGTARSRWSPENGSRYLLHHGDRQRTAAEAARRRGTGTRRRRAPGDHALPVGSPTDPEAQLTSALSHLQRSSGKSMSRIAEETDLSPSFVSRLISGERFPSWPTVQHLVTALGGEPEHVRPLWQAARGEGISRPFLPGLPGARRYATAGLQATLQGLYLASACPPEQEVASRATQHVTVSQVTSILDGQGVESWSIVSAVVEALRGHPDQVRPWWERVQLSLDPTWTPQKANPGTSSHCAGAFG